MKENMPSCNYILQTDKIIIHDLRVDMRYNALSPQTKFVTGTYMLDDHSSIPTMGRNIFSWYVLPLLRTWAYFFWHLHNEAVSISDYIASNND
jgi:hypothetical protein